MNETKIISVTNDKGGVGKTTTVHNFGYALMKKGYRVLLVDFNAQCDLTAELGIAEPDAENNTLCDAMRPYIMDTDGFLDTAECIRENPNGLDFLPATQELADLETLMIQAYQREMILSSILQEIAGQYDFILIDCPGSLGQLMVNALMASNEVILAAFPEKNSLAGLSKIMNFIDQISRRMHRKIQVRGVLFNRVDVRETDLNKLLKDAKAHVKRELPFFNNWIPKRVSVARAVEHAASIFEYEPSSDAAIAYAKLANEYLKQAGGEKRNGKSA